ncbi:hypothetical protein Adt_19943 [Abeliophyllum distichum]|uniref:Uncharacterized protein n=1 Tax=Abeliophyllum distichum TaxID=126358 RepID=A0ABD1SVN9_9LAMI
MSAESQWERQWMSVESLWERHWMSAESLWERHWMRLLPLNGRRAIAESLWERQLNEACSLQNKFEEIILEQKRRIFFKVSGKSYLRQLFRSCLRGIGGDNTGCGGGEASSHVLPVLEGVLPIRGVDGSMGEAIPIVSTSGLREAEDPYRADVVRWAAMDVPSIMVEEDLTKLREAYRIPADIELILPDTNE